MKTITSEQYLEVFAADSKLAAKERELKKQRAGLKKSKLALFGKAQKLSTPHGTTIEIVNVTVSAAVIQREEYTYTKIVEK